MALVPLVDELVGAVAGLHGNVYPAPAHGKSRSSSGPVTAGARSSVPASAPVAPTTRRCRAPAPTGSRTAGSPAPRSRSCKAVEMPRPLIAIDGPFLLYRSFFALPDSIKGVDGHPVNALLGAANLTLRIAADKDPRAIVVCFGAEAAAYRVQLYPDYHAARPPVPDALAWQFDQAPEFFDAFGWASLTSEGLEADDLLGSLGEVEAAAGGRALLMTGDRDMYQCAGERVSVLYPEVGQGRVRGDRPGGGPQALRDSAGARPGLHRAARRSLRRAAGGAGDRAEDGGRAAGPARVARGGDRRRGGRAAADRGGAARPRRRAPRVRGHRHAADGRCRAPGGPGDGPRRWRRGGQPLRHGAARRAPRERREPGRPLAATEPEPASYGANLTVITSPSVTA